MDYAIIVAGGTGTRMSGGNIPKQFIEIAGKPVIVHTIQAFLTAIPDIKIIVTVPVLWRDHWYQIEKKYFSKQNLTTTEGGETRFHSVKKALKYTKPSTVIAVHDAVRPVISPELIIKAFKHAAENQTAVPAISVNDSLRKKENSLTVSVDRSNYIIIQTPQCFRQELLIKAYEQPYRENFTDDASVLESLEIPLSFFEGSKNNIKITVPEDLRLAECLLKNNH